MDDDDFFYPSDDEDNYYYSDDEGVDEEEVASRESIETPEKLLRQWNSKEYAHIIECFPSLKYNIRCAQLEILKRTIKALYNGKMTILIQAPTGVGKSAISYTALVFSEYGYVCSSTKALQEQILGDYSDLVRAYGRANFTCLRRGINPKTKKPYNCEHGACQVLKESCPLKPTFKKTPWKAYFSVKDHKQKYWQIDPKKTRVCPYWESKAAALNNFAVVHNYSYILAEANHAHEFTTRLVLIGDEAHNIESKIIDFIKIPITLDHLDVINKFLDADQKVRFVKTDKDMPNFTKMRLYAAWVTDLSNKIPVVQDRIKAEAMKAMNEREELQTKLAECVKKKEKWSEEEKRDLAERLEAKEMRLEDLFDIQNKIDKLMKRQINFFLKDIAVHLENWVVKVEEDKLFGIKRIEFQPIEISQYAKGLYFRLGIVNILQSATILDPVRFCTRLGLDPNPNVTEYIEIEPNFPVENHKIFNLNWADFGQCKNETTETTETEEELEDFYRRVIERIDIIIDLFPDERGIIHATSYPIAEYFMKYSKHANWRLTFHGKEDRTEKLEEHKEKKGSVLVSPSMTEGVDLKDDLSRFQILIKIPFPDMSDERVKARMAKDTEGYYYETAVTLIQSIGRSVRSEKDHAITFCLDNRMPGFIRLNRNIMDLYTRYLCPTWEIKKLDNLKDKPEVAKLLTQKIKRPKKEAEKLMDKKKRKYSKLF